MLLLAFPLFGAGHGVVLLFICFMTFFGMTDKIGIDEERWL
jgi:hypothetical protein